jgi:single-strand DNA-binding protein
MAKGINKVILIGNLGAAPEVRYMPSGGAVATLSVATSESWKDKQTGERQDRTEWHRVAVFNRLAEIARDYLKKGSKIYVEGSLRTRKWQDKASGQDRYTTEIIANDIQMLDGKTGGDQSVPPEYEAFSQQSSDNNGSGDFAQENAASTNAGASSHKDNKDFDDDIPF